MIIDSRSGEMPHRIDTDVCIVGGGAAGITVARELIGSGLQVCLLESGGFEYDRDVDELNRGRSIGRSYPVQYSRNRWLGGSTNTWGGTCRPLDPMDFRVREWIPHSGWPISKDELDPYYKTAHAICQLGPYDYEAASWESEDVRRLPIAEDRIYSGVFQHSPPTRFGEVYREDLERAVNVRVYLNATVLDFRTNPAGTVVDLARVASLGGSEFEVVAKYFVLAAGGIESPRLLLLSDHVHGNGLGNGNDLVGRFFTEHPIIHGTAVAMLDEDAVDLEFYQWWRIVRGAEVGGTLLFREETQRRHRLLNCGVRLRYSPVAPAVEAARRLLGGLRRREVPEDLGEEVWSIIKDLDDVAAHANRKLFGPLLVDLSYWAEPLPNPDSRVLLDAELDRFGQRRVKVDWRLSAADRKNVDTSHQLLAEEFGKAGIGRLKLNFPAGEYAWPETLRVDKSNHHNGTLRMASSAKEGVVDANCRLFEVPNLYVAGSAVFPISGHANPTLTIVALAVRLAEHLKGLPS